MDSKKVIVITGGGDGAGKEMARKLSDNNIVVIISRTKNKLERVAEELNCNYEVCDVADYKSVESTINTIITKYKKIDCLINNAGLWMQDKLEDNDYERIKQVIEANTLGVIYTTKAVIPYMKQNNDGIIININSQAGINYKAERSVYTSSKWAITGFTKCMQAELAPYGIRITDIMPGLMKTEFHSKVGNIKNMDNGLDVNEIARVVEFILATDKNVIIPEIGIKNINN